jgi:WD40 repeat protein
MHRVALAAVLALAAVCPSVRGRQAPRLTLAPDDRQVLHVWFSRDGKTLAVLNGDEPPKPDSKFALRFYDAVGGQLQATVPVDPAGAPLERLVTGFFSTEVTVIGRDLRVISAATGREMATFKPERGARAAAYRPRVRQSIASVDGRNAVQLWDVHGQTARTILPPADEARLDVGFSPNGHLLAISTARGLVLWDVDGGRERVRIDARAPWVFSWDGRLLIAGVPSTPGRTNGLAVFDTSTGAVLARLIGHTDVVEHVDISLDRQTVATGGRDGVRIWNLETGKEQAIAHRDWRNKLDVRALAFIRPPWPWVFYEARNRAGVIDPTSGVELGAIPVGKTILPHAGQTEGAPVYGSPAICPNGTMIAWPVTFRLTGDRFSPARVRSVVEVWDVPASIADLQAQGWRPEPLAIQQPARDKAITAEWPPADFDKRPVAAATLIRTVQRPIPINGMGGRERLVRVSPDGRLLAQWDVREVYLSEIDTGRERAKLKTGDGSNRYFEFLEDGAVLAIGQSQSIRLWEVAAGRDKAVIARQSLADRPIISRDRGTLTISGEGGIRIWEAASGREKTGAGKGKLLGSPIALTADGSLLAWYRWQEPIRIWDVAAGRETAILANTPGYVRSAAFSPDGRTLATIVDGDLAIRLWDVDTGREKARLVGHGGQLLAAFFSPDGQVLVSGDTLWDVATGAERARLSRYEPTIRFGDRGRIRFSPQAFTTDGKAAFGSNPARDDVNVSGSHIVFGGNALCDWPTGALLSRVPDPPLGSPEFFSQLGTTFASGRNGHFVARWFANGTVEVWDLTPGRTRPK